MDFNKTIKIIRKVFIWILGIWAVLMLILQIVLLPPIFTPIVNSLAGDFVNADVYVGRASGSVFTNFPRISFDIEDIEITYPHERYDSLARAGAQHELLYSGCGQTVDTLARIKRVSASISLYSLLWSEIKVPEIEIESPVIHAHSYDSGHANWDIFGSTEVSDTTETADTTAEDTSDDSSAEEGMRLILRRINITGSPKITYTDSKDSLFVLLNMESAGFHGNFEPDALHKTMANAYVNMISLTGRFGTDTLSVTIPKMSMSPEGDIMHTKILAKACTALDANELINIPIAFEGDLGIPYDEGLAITLHNIQSSVGSVPAEGYIEVRMRSDSTIMDGQLDIKDHKIQPLLNMYLSYLDKDMAKMKTDTEVSVHATLNGVYGGINETMPELNVDIVIPDSEINHESFPDKINLGLVANAQMDKAGLITAEIFRAMLKTYGLDLKSSMNTTPCGDDDREVYIDGNMRVSLDSLRAFLPDTLNMTANGGFSLKMNGSTKLSYLDMYKFSQSGLEGSLSSDCIIFSMPEDTVNLNIADMEITLMPESFTSRRDPAKQIRLMGINGSLGSAEIKYKDAVTFTGEELCFTAKNSADQTDESSDDIKYVSGSLNAKDMFLEDSEGTSIKLENTENTFRIRPDFHNPTIPVLSLSNKNLRITYVTPDNRAILTDSKIKAKATMNSVNREARKEAHLDSLAIVYPDIPRDSLFKHAKSQKRNKANKSWMIEEDFIQSDLKFDINESARKYFREWDLEGEVGIRTGIIMTPQFPLRNIIRGIYFSFTNDMASIDSLKINAGESQLCAKGSLSNLKKAVLRNGTFKLGLNITSESVNADELLNAYAIGSQYQPKTEDESTEELTNAEFFKQVTSDTVKIERPTSSLVVIPGNLEAEIGIGMSGIKYQDLDISRMSGNIAVRERCAQIKGATFESNVGNAYLDAFYTVRNKKDIKTGFCLDLKDITSERVISLMPQISSVMPMIESIQGKLNCEVAVTAALDTTMSIQMSTVNGIARLGGSNLVVSNDETYTAIAKKLMFKNKRKGEIKELMVEGVIKDNRLEIYPFILAVDRYRLALTGIQNADMSYKHHISVLRSPLLIRLGLNLSGPDYDNMKFNLGRAQYRSKKMPSFTAVIDQTKIDLKHSIYNIFETGVDETIENRNTLGLIDQHRSETGYINVAELELEQLSDEDMKKFSEMESTEEALNEFTSSVIEAVQKALKNN